jgi:hypothetical protein
MINRGTLIALAAWLTTAPLLADDSLDVNIQQGESKDELLLTKPSPPTDIAFDRVAPLSREGQTDRVLSGPVEHMTGVEQMKLLEDRSRQVFYPLPVKIPQAPFVRMEVLPGLTSQSWELQVVDQEGRSNTVLTGRELPKYVLEWDGFKDNVLTLKAGPAYTPILVVKDERGRTQRLFGEPVQFSALYFVQDKARHVEFDNGRLFDRGRASFASDVGPLLEACLHLLRREMSGPVRITVAPGPHAQKRADVLKKFFLEGLALEETALSIQVLSAAGERGDVTDVSMAVSR